MKILISIMATLLLAGCASPYKPEGLGGGYSETQYDENVYKISFRGNGYTSPEQAAEMCLLRASELGLKNNYPYFIIVDNNSYTMNSTYTTPTQTTTNANVSTFGNASVYGNNINYNQNSYGSATSTTTGGQTYVISKPKTVNLVVFFKEKPQVNGIVYKSEYMANSLASKYGVTLK